MVTTAASPMHTNLFANNTYYVNARYQARVRASMNKLWVDTKTRASLKSMQSTGSAFWIDTIDKVLDSHNDLTLLSACREAATKPRPPLVVAVLYDLPNRDCHAKASLGELCCEYAPDGTCIFEASDPTCSEGLTRYKHHYVDKFAGVLERYSQVPVAVIIEPCVPLPPHPSPCTPTPSLLQLPPRDSYSCCSAGTRYLTSPPTSGTRAVARPREISESAHLKLLACADPPVRF